MAIPKSTNERIRRKLRSKKVGPKGKDLTGRIVVKKPANNDPRRNRKISQDFLEWYRGSKIDDPNKFSVLVEKLIDIAIEASDKVQFPFSISRLNELRESINSDLD